MGLLLDSALLPEIKRVAESYPVSGVTTNPSIVLQAVRARQHLSTVELVHELLQIVPGPVFVQPSALHVEGLVAEGSSYLDLSPGRVVLKLALTPLGLAAGMRFIQQGSRVAFTAVFSPPQAYTAALAGAEWIIPYYGRLRRTGVDAAERIGEMRRLLTAQAAHTRILAASLKSPLDLVDAVNAGAHDVTVPVAVVESLLTDPLTEAAVAQFAADADETTMLLGK